MPSSLLTSQPSPPPAPPRETAASSRRGVLPVWLLLAAGLLATALATRATLREVDSTAEREFQFVCSEIREKINDRLHAHVQTLRSWAAFYRHSGGVTRKDWREFTEEQRIEELFPGIQGIGFALLLQKSQLAQHVASIRAEGFPDYSLRPPGDRDYYTSIIYLEPFTNRNLRAFGYDMASEPVRRAAMEKARDDDTAILSGKVTLVQETDKDVQAGTLMYVPVYRSDEPRKTVAERRASLMGWAYIPFRMNDLMRGILGGRDLQDDRRIRLEVFDGREPSPETRMYDSQAAGGRSSGNPPRFTLQRQLLAASREWTLRFTWTGKQASPLDYSKVWLVLAGGTLTSLLVSGLLYNLLNTRQKALRMAMRLTADLREMAVARDQLLGLLQKIASRVPGVVFQYRSFPDGRSSIPYASEAIRELFRVSPEDVENDATPIFDRIHPEDRPGFIDSILTSARDLTPWQQEYRVHFPDGTERWYLGTAMPEREESGSTLWHGFVADVTDRRLDQRALQRRTEDLLEVNAALARAAQGRDEFLARVSHELRTPLTSILNLTEMLLDHENGQLNERQERYIKTLLTSSQHLLQLINDVLDIARLEAGQLKVEIAPVHCDDVLADSIRLIRPQASMKKLGLVVNVERSGLIVNADALRLKQMLVNLLGNAIKFTPPGGQVRADLLHEEGQAVFKISDTGIGIPKDRLGSLFQPFVQIDSGLNRRFGGSGLGLAIVKHFAELHRGSVAVETELDKGSTFIIRIPLKEGLQPAPAPRLACSDSPAAPPAPTSAIRVLIVDDDNLNRGIISEYLSASGFEVHSAEDGHTALRMIGEFVLDVVVLDVQMPGLDGLEVTRRIRSHANPAISGVPVLGLTALAMPEDRQVCMTAGMTAYQSKPIALKALRELILQLAERHATPHGPAAATPKHTS